MASSISKGSTRKLSAYHQRSQAARDTDLTPAKQMEIVVASLKELNRALRKHNKEIDHIIAKHGL